MNIKRFACACLAIFVFALLWNGVVHLVILRDANMALEQLARPAEERSLALGLLLTAGVAVPLLFVHPVSGEGSAMVLSSVCSPGCSSI